MLQRSVRSGIAPHSNGLLVPYRRLAHPQRPLGPLITITATHCFQFRFNSGFNFNLNSRLLSYVIIEYAAMNLGLRRLILVGARRLGSKNFSTVFHP